MSSNVCIKNYRSFQLNYKNIKQFLCLLLQALENPDSEANAVNGPNVLDKERNLMNEDPKWQGKQTLILFKYAFKCLRGYVMCEVP